MVAFLVLAVHMDFDLVESADIPHHDRIDMRFAVLLAVETFAVAAAVAAGAQLVLLALPQELAELALVELALVEPVPAEPEQVGHLQAYPRLHQCCFGGCYFLRS